MFCTFLRDKNCICFYLQWFVTNREKAAKTKTEIELKKKGGAVWEVTELREQIAEQMATFPSQRWQTNRVQTSKKRFQNVDSYHIELSHLSSLPVRAPLETLDHPVLLDPLVLALTCPPLPDWVRPRRVPTLSGTCGPTRPLETCGSTTPRSMPRSSLSTTRSRTSAAPRDPRRILLAPAGTWSSATLTGRAVSDGKRNWPEWREMGKRKSWG